MALRDVDIENFETLVRAARNGDLALVETKDENSGEYRAVICAVDRGPIFGTAVIPFGHLSPNDPYAEYANPTKVSGIDMFDEAVDQGFIVEQRSFEPAEALAA